ARDRGNAERRLLRTPSTGDARAHARCARRRRSAHRARGARPHSSRGPDRADRDDRGRWAQPAQHARHGGAGDGHRRTLSGLALRIVIENDHVSQPEYTLFHRVHEPASARVRTRVVELGLKPRIDFQNAETDGKDDLARLGGSVTPALWDGRALTVGEERVAQKLAAMRPERDDGW